jgi:DNA-binding FrmR family transcriptional regulator
MAEVNLEKQKLLNRLMRLRGQIDGLRKAVDGDVKCAKIIQQATACRGALDGFIAELIEVHIREHMIDPDISMSDPKIRAAEDLVSIIKSYLL